MKLELPPLALQFPVYFLAIIAAASSTAHKLSAGTRMLTRGKGHWQSGQCEWGCGQTGRGVNFVCVLVQVEFTAILKHHKILVVFCGVIFLFCSCCVLQCHILVFDQFCVGLMSSHRPCCSQVCQPGLSSPPWLCLPIPWDRSSRLHAPKCVALGSGLP